MSLSAAKRIAGAIGRYLSPEQKIESIKDRMASARPFYDFVNSEFYNVHFGPYMERNKTALINKATMAQNPDDRTRFLSKVEQINDIENDFRKESLLYSELSTKLEERGNNA